MMIMEKLNNYKKCSSKKLKKIRKKMGNPVKSNKKGAKTHRSKRTKDNLHSKTRNRNYRLNNELSEI
jgi:hypothetical protein